MKKYRVIDTVSVYTWLCFSLYDWSRQ